MKVLLTNIHIIALCIGAWAVFNGVLHDIFVLTSEHGKKYDRELLRLLMDGHILITCGVLQVVSFIGLRSNEPWAWWVAGIACLSLLVYCGMIFPFLKSVGTIALNLFLLALLIISYAKVH